MASNFLIGFLFGVGCAGWVYAKVLRSSGGNTKSALIVAAVTGVGVLALTMTILKIVFKK